MKKIFAILTLGLAGSAFAADFVSIDIDRVSGLGKGAKDSTAEYVRAGKGIGNYQFGLQSRTAKFEGGGLANSLELTMANNKINFGGITPFVGAGYDNGFNGAGKSFQYGLVGATTGAKVGPGFAFVGVKTRVGSTQDGPRTKQTVAFGTYSLPVIKNVDLNLNVSKSYQTIQENAVGLGLAFRF